jgi:hypothetical protein
MVQNELGLKAPRGFGWITHPKKAMYNKVYNKTSTGCLLGFLLFLGLPLGLLWCFAVN